MPKISVGIHLKFVGQYEDASDGIATWYSGLRPFRDNSESDEIVKLLVGSFGKEYYPVIFGDSNVIRVNTDSEWRQCK